MIRRSRRGSQVGRQWRVLTALSDGDWATVDQLRRRIPLPRPHRRTIMRDLEVLVRIFPLEREGGPGDRLRYRLPGPVAAVMALAASWRRRRATTSGRT